MTDFTCELVGQGWFRSTFDNGESSLTIDATYLTDAPLQLIEKLILISDSINEAVCYWQSEPGEYRLLFKNEEDYLTLQVLRLEKNFSKSDNENAELLFTGKEDKIKFIRRVLREFEKLKMLYTDIEYEKIWGHEFPTQAINRLRIYVKK